MPLPTPAAPSVGLQLGGYYMNRIMLESQLRNFLKQECAGRFRDIENFKVEIRALVPKIFKNDIPVQPLHGIEQSVASSMHFLYRNSGLVQFAKGVGYACA